MEQCLYLSLSPFLLMTFLIFVFLAKIKPRNCSRRRRLQPKLPPEPPKLPFIGNLHLFIGTLPHHLLRDLAKKYGPIMHLQLGELSTIVISSPEAAKQLIQTHDVNFSNRPCSFAASFISYNFMDIIFAPYGDHWRQLRKICTMEVFSTKRVQSFRGIREEEVAYFIREISSRAGSPINLRKRLQSLSYSIISRSAFGKKYEDQDDFTKIVQEAIDLFSGFSLFEVFPSLKLLHCITGATSKFQKLHQKIDKVVGNIIEEHKAKKATSRRCKDPEVNDLVDILLNFQDHEDFGIHLTDSTIKAIIMDIFSAGGETTSTTIEWALSEILKNPRVLDKVQTEVRQHFSSEGDVNETGLEGLKYLNLVIKETLRLHPPAPLIPRESRERCEINGYDIPAKTQVILNAWGIGRDPNYWTNCEKFYPERFLDGSIDFKGANIEFIPFGLGRRICPGMSFGVANIKLSLAQLLYHFDWKLSDGRNLEDLDMTEAFGVAVSRKHDLCLVPISYCPMSIECSYQ